jgi:glycosyltransferase involved in cell wall biosynthesis
LTAALDHAPRGLHLRIYTAATLPVETADYVALRSLAVPLPFVREAEMFLPHLGAYLNRIRRDRIDVVHIATPGPVGLAGLYAAWRLNLPVVGTVHVDMEAFMLALGAPRHVTALVSAYARRVYAACARLLVPSEATRTRLSGSIERSRMTVWSRGVDASFFSPDGRSRTLRDQWHVSDNRPALLYVGRLSNEKGVDLLPALQRELYERRREHRFIIAGDGPMRANLQRRMPDAVFTGIVGRRRVATVFASADAFVFPCGADTDANVVLEAQASGLPVVVRGGGGSCENLIDGGSGIVCESDEPEVWAEAVSRVAMPRSRATFAEAARAYAIARPWTESLQVLYRAYGEAATGAAGSTGRIGSRPRPFLRPTRPLRAIR